MASQAQKKSCTAPSNLPEEHSFSCSSALPTLLESVNNILCTYYAIPSPITLHNTLTISLLEESLSFLISPRRIHYPKILHLTFVCMWEIQSGHSKHTEDSFQKWKCKLWNSTSTGEDNIWDFQSQYAQDCTRWMTCLSVYSGKHYL